MDEFWYQMTIYDYLKEVEVNDSTKKAKDQEEDISNVE